MNSRHLNFISIWFHPILLSILATSLIAFILPLHTPKFISKVEEEGNIYGNKTFLYEDIDGNGYSDRITALNNIVGTFGISLVLEPSKKAAQWNFTGSLDFFTNDFLIIDDYDNNGLKEMYLFSLASDSIFLHRIEFLPVGNIPTFTRFITKVGMINGKTMSAILPTRMADLDRDGKKELIFGINSGFTKYPRNIYAYNFVNDSLLTSPENGFYLIGIIQTDANNDSLPEFLLRGYASENIADTSIKYHDRSCWMMVLDHHLDFLFPPYELKGDFGGILPYVLPDEPFTFSAIYFRPGEQKLDLFGYRFTFSGFPEKKVPLSNLDVILQPEPIIIKRGKSWYNACNNGSKEFTLIGKDLHKTGTINGAPTSSILNIFQGDLDGNEGDEIVLLSNHHNQLAIYQPNLHHPVFVSIPLQSHEFTTISTLKSPSAPTLLCIASDSKRYLVSYNLNLMYYGRWGIYSGIYFSVFLFTLLVKKITRIQIEKRLNTEKKITELQLKIVRNQMDPHFTMNAINSVIDAVNRQEKEEARASLMHFSKMYRSMVVYADKIKRTLAEELDFTTNYLALEKFRFRDRFDFTISVDPAVNPNWEIPKMVVQSPVENAIKHGLAPLLSGGKLEIRAFMEGDLLILTIQDNGVGRDQSEMKNKSSTGKGVIIMDQFLVLYCKITGKKVSSVIQDLFNKEGQSSGTKVIIRIPVSDK